MPLNEQTNALRGALHVWDALLTARHPKAGLYSPELRERFWSRVQPDPVTGCLRWTGTIDADGHPTMEGPYGKCKATRIAKELAEGRKLTGLYVCPSCSTPDCVDPNHMYIASSPRNGGNGGLRRKRCNLQPVEVIRMRAEFRDGVRVTELARKYGCTVANVCSIVKRQTWKELA